VFGEYVGVLRLGSLFGVFFSPLVISYQRRSLFVFLYLGVRIGFEHNGCVEKGARSVATNGQFFNTNTLLPINIFDNAEITALRPSFEVTSLAGMLWLPGGVQGFMKLDGHIATSETFVPAEKAENINMMPSTIRLTMIDLG
jgi:hypothetical protein